MVVPSSEVFRRKDYRFKVTGVKNEFLEWYAV